MKLKIKIDGEIEELDVKRQGDRLWVTRGEVTQAVRVLGQDGAAVVWAVDEGGDGFRVGKSAGISPTKQSPNQRHLWHDGKHIRYERIPNDAVLSGGGDDGDASLMASIPAVVSEVLVAVGDAVTAGQKLILLESMKMVIPIVAGNAGIIKAIHCEAGEAVQPGVALLEME
jgi:biotin carboxyl carrier protein